MTGRRRSSFRAGDLAEHLGLLLLKGIAAVAEVSRPEDIGLDAVATLLRRETDGNSYAEDSFLVQLKSASTTSITYEAHETEWFKQQRLPMFIGLVSMSQAQIELYSTIYVSQSLLSMHATKAVMRFGESGLPPFLRGQQFSPWKGTGGLGVEVWLGPPVACWKLDDLSNVESQLRIYETLKQFLIIVLKELFKISLGQISVLHWQTNAPSSFSSTDGIEKGSEKGLAEIVDQCSPSLQSLVLHANALPQQEAIQLISGAVMIADALVKAGFETIDARRLQMMLHIVMTRQEKGPPTADVLGED